jgi:hypothetical protein
MLDPYLKDYQKTIVSDSTNRDLQQCLLHYYPRAGTVTLIKTKINSNQIEPFVFKKA